MIREAQDSDMESVRELFLEYQEFLGFDLCFQSFQDELARLPGDYSAPRGCLKVVELKGRLVACVAVRDLSDGVCEMKRLYVRPEARSRGLGRALCLATFDFARRAGYTAMRLDTVRKLERAVGLYREFGFVEIPSYCFNPHPEVIFMELKLGEAL